MLVEFRTWTKTLHPFRCSGGRQADPLRQFHLRQAAFALQGVENPAVGAVDAVHQKGPVLQSPF